MKISFLSEGDAANVLTEYSYCLNKHSDIESKSICTIPHPFNYTIKHDYNINVCNSIEIQEVKQWILNSEVFILNEESTSNGTYRMLDIINKTLGIDLLSLNKKILIWHPGSNYRNNYQYYNNHPLRDKIFKHLYAIDLYHLSPKHDCDIPLHPYQYYQFNYDKFINDFKIKLNADTRTILHIPSNSNIKGTAIISNCINELNLHKTTNYRYKTLQKISNHSVILEKEKSFFYIDQVNDMGGYGIAAVEAFFRSNLVFCTTHNSTDAVYKLTNKHEIPIVSLPQPPREIKEIIYKFISLSDNEILQIMKQIGQWIDIHYNPNNIVLFFKKLLNE